MLNIAVIDTNRNLLNQVGSCVNELKELEELRLSFFSSSEDFLKNPYPYEIIFIQIDMPDIDGLKIAHAMRSRRITSIIIYVTSRHCITIDPTFVTPMDYVLLPVSNEHLKEILMKALRIYHKYLGFDLTLKSARQIHKINTSSVVYVDVSDHLLVYHTINGDIDIWSTIKEAEKLLPSSRFVRVNLSKIINIIFVEKYIGNTIYLRGGIEITLSQSKKEAFISLLKATFPTIYNK